MTVTVLNIKIATIRYIPGQDCDEYPCIQIDPSKKVNWVKQELVDCAWKPCKSEWRF